MRRQHRIRLEGVEQLDDLLDPVLRDVAPCTVPGERGDNMRATCAIWMSDAAGVSPVDVYIGELRVAAGAGFQTVWSPQLVRNPDLLCFLGLALREVERINVGVGVMPIQTRHPITLAQQALTVDLLAPGRLKLGVGVTHPFIAERVYGLPWQRNVGRLDDYLDVLLPLLSERTVKNKGEFYPTAAALAIETAEPPPVYVAALGAQMLRLAGRRTAGTVTAYCGPKTLAARVLPALRKAGAEVGRTPELVSFFPVCVTDDVDAVRAFAAEALKIYGAQPSYRSMLDQEGVSGPEDIGLIGPEADVRDRLVELAALGVDELVADLNVTRNPDEKQRTIDLLSSFNTLNV